MANNRAAHAAQALEGGQRGIGVAIAKMFLWLSFGNGSSFVYTLVSAWVLYFWTTDESRAIGVLAGFGVYSLIYLIIQILTLLFTLYRTGGSMVRALADIGTSLMPGVPLIILGTMVFMGGFSPTWLSYVVGVETALTVAVDILAVLLFMRATQKTFETPDAAHPS
jgi:hypothetical protein